MRLISISSCSISPSFRCASDNSSNWNLQDLNLNAVAMLGLLILNLLTLAFSLYNFEKFGDIYPTILIT